MKVINLFGAPSAGKSTTSAGLFFLMKINHELISSVEIVTEFAKDLVYSGRTKELAGDNQLYIASKQYGRLHRLRGQVDYVVTDSPILLSSVYVADKYFPSFKPLVKEMFDSFDNINFYINRTKPYKAYGRTQNEEEAYLINDKVLNILAEYSVDYVDIDGDMDAPEKIFETIKKIGGLNDFKNR